MVPSFFLKIVNYTAIDFLKLLYLNPHRIYLIYSAKPLNHARPYFKSYVILSLKWEEDPHVLQQLVLSVDESLPGTAPTLFPAESILDSSLESYLINCRTTACRGCHLGFLGRNVCQVITNDGESSRVQKSKAACHYYRDSLMREARNVNMTSPRGVCSILRLENFGLILIMTLNSTEPSKFLNFTRGLSSQGAKFPAVFLIAYLHQSGIINACRRLKMG